MNTQTGIVNIRGKEYQTVALRVQMFRDSFPEHSLTTSIVSRDDECVVMQAAISDPAGRVIATGHSEEMRKASQINRTSALENAETSAIGRALATFGFGGTEFATADEVANAIHQQKAGGHSQEDAVSPPPAKRENWGGMYPTKTALHKAMNSHAAELRRIGDEGVLDDLEGYITSPEYAAFVETAQKHMPHYLEGGHPAPPEFEGVYAIEQRAKELIQLRNNQPA